MFIPSLIGLLVYSLGILFEVLNIKATKVEHTKEDVKNARRWFIYLSLPFFDEDYFLSMWHKLAHEELKMMVEVYGNRPFNKWLKIYFPFSAKYGALDAYNLKTGNSLMFVE
ncbi:hypothetical protein D2U88_16090 [Flagellimonas aequoris]|uniref:Uncharacterized protein n=1 Tax=Flagellimonas aequoris TaxID=2306997 RepID=A0A418N4D6_9FLAO|nr:hypothetical protein D2U88_16090 [Allomuricauda aequoris]